MSSTELERGTARQRKATAQDEFEHRAKVDAPLEALDQRLN